MNPNLTDMFVYTIRYAFSVFVVVVRSLLWIDGSNLSKVNVKFQHCKVQMNIESNRKNKKKTNTSFKCDGTHFAISINFGIFGQ